MGEVQYLVVVEHYNGGLCHHQAVHAVVEQVALCGVGAAAGTLVEAVGLGKVEACVVGTCGSAVGRIEEGEVVLGIGIVGHP